jgi:hypothetical protein
MLAARTVCSSRRMPAARTACSSRCLLAPQLARTSHLAYSALPKLPILPLLVLRVACSTHHLLVLPAAPRSLAPGRGARRRSAQVVLTPRLLVDARTRASPAARGTHSPRRAAGQGRERRSESRRRRRRRWRGSRGRRAAMRRGCIHILLTPSRRLGRCASRSGVEVVGGKQAS